MRLPELFRTTSFRLAAGYTALFTLSVLAIMGTAYLVATSEMRGIVRASMVDDLNAFRLAFREHGVEGVRQAVEERTEDAADDRFFLLVGAERGVLAGNLPAELWRPGWSDRKVSGRVLRENANLKAIAARNPDGELLLFGYGETIGPLNVFAARDWHIIDETQEIMISALLWGSLGTALLALVGGFIVSIGPTRRVDAIAATTRRIVGGELHLRLPVSKRRDEIDRLAGDINVMLSRIETLLESLRQVSTDIAHDLRTPLARLRQRLDTARRRARTTEDYGTAIEEAMADTDAIIETFNALLRIAQIEAGARKAKFGPTDLSRLMEKIADIYGEVAVDAGHLLTARVEPDLIADGDAELLTQALANLVENAINHALTPVSITLEAGRHGDGIVLDIADDGPGIPESEREKVFRRLYRLDRSRSTPGSGLGLALVSAVVELHEGSVEAQDNGPGLRMHIVLPNVTTDHAGSPMFDNLSV